MAGMISDAWAYAIDPAIREHFNLGFGRRPQLGPVLFNVQSSDNAYEEIFGSGALGVDAWDNYENAGVPSEADFNQWYKATFTHREYPLIVGIERKLYADAQFANIFNIAEKIGDSAALKREVDASSVFNNAFTSAFAGPDGVELCDAAHPASAHDASTTQSNILALALTETNLATARRTMMAFKDDKNNLLSVTPDLLIVPPELEDTALKLVRSQLEPGTANNAINPNAGRFRVLPWHYLTDSDAWFLVDSNRMRQSLRWFDREPVQIKPMVEDKTLRARWIGYMRYSYGWTDWRWVLGSNPA